TPNSVGRTWPAHWFEGGRSKSNHPLAIISAASCSERAVTLRVKPVDRWRTVKVTVERLAGSAMRNICTTMKNRLTKALLVRRDTISQSSPNILFILDARGRTPDRVVPPSVDGSYPLEGLVVQRIPAFLEGGWALDRGG